MGRSIELQIKEVKNEKQNCVNSCKFDVFKG